MNQLFLLKLIYDFLPDDPTKDQVACAKTILKGLIEEAEKKPLPYAGGRTPAEAKYNLEHNPMYFNPSQTQPLLDEDGEAARRELQ